MMTSKKKHRRSRRLSLISELKAIPFLQYDYETRWFEDFRLIGTNYVACVQYEGVIIWHYITLSGAYLIIPFEEVFEDVPLEIQNQMIFYLNVLK